MSVYSHATFVIGLSHVVLRATQVTDKDGTPLGVWLGVAWVDAK